MDQETFRLLEFEQVLAIVEEFAHSPAGKSRVWETAPCTEIDSLQRKLAVVAEASHFSHQNQRFRFDHLEAVEDILAALEQPTAVLSTQELRILLAYLTCLQTLKKSFHPEHWPSLAATLDPVEVPGLLLQQLGASIDESGEIRQDTYPELAAVRRQYERSRSAVQQHLERLLKGAQAKFLIPDPFVTQRADRWVVPVRVDCQRSVPGIVHATSSSGATVFVEPFSAVELNNQQIYFRSRETELIAKILRDLTDLARRSRSELRQLVHSIAEIDFIFACAAFGARFRCVSPELNCDGVLRLKEARHVLLQHALGEKKVVPISISLDRAHGTLVISGPNTGGKTAALKTVGLICLMAHCGLPVPAQEANLPLLADILADIGDHQSITQQLSTFSAHIRRIQEIQQLHQVPSLLLLDEVGRGTDPAYGAALAIAVVEFFRRRGAMVMATTHHRAVKSYASAAPGVTNASVCLDPETFRPTYQLEFGSAGSSSGLEIARQLGLSSEIVELAREQLADGEIQVEQYLDQLRDELARLQATRADLEDQIAEFRLREREVAAEAAQREGQRQVDHERRLEQWAAEFKREGARYLKRVQDRFEAAQQKRDLQQREAALKEAFRRRLAGEKSRPAEPPLTVAAGLAEGDRVYHSFFQKRGTILTLNQKEALVEIEGKRVTARLDQLAKLETREVVQKPVRQVTVAVIEDTDPELNLVGMTVEEALEAADKFLDRAFVSQLKEIRIIHGFGKGRLRSSISQFLKQHPQVSDFTLEGGSTRVQLSV